jgi:hypothetical protein
LVAGAILAPGVKARETAATETPARFATSIDVIRLVATLDALRHYGCTLGNNKNYMSHHCRANVYATCR